MCYEEEEGEREGEKERKRRNADLFVCRRERMKGVAGGKGERERKSKQWEGMRNGARGTDNSGAGRREF